MNTEKVFKNVKDISITKSKNGNTVRIDNNQAIELSKATNFEWRVTDDCMPAFTHMYFGNETNNDEFNFNISFQVPYDVRIGHPDARCYGHLEKLDFSFKKQ
jgi:hypothetical protein